MENASKALIIAGAILLAILIISLGLIVYNQAKEKHPEWWSKETRDWSFSEEEWLNPKQEKETKTEAKAS